MNFRIKILSVALEFQVERQVINSGNDKINLLDRNVDIVRELGCGMLNAVTKADGTNTGRLVQGPAIHRHGIDIVQMHDIRTEPFHLLAHVDQDRDGSQCPHNPANTEGIGDGLTETVPFWDIEVSYRAWPVTTDLDHVDCVGGAIKCSRAICRRLYFSGCTKCFRNPVCDNFGSLQAGLIDVEKANRGIGKLRKRQDISHQILRKDRASGPNKRDLSSCVTHLWLSADRLLHFCADYTRRTVFGVSLDCDRLLTIFNIAQ